MILADLKEKLGLKTLAGAEGLDRELTGGYTSDLISDVLARSRPGQVWITLQCHLNVVAAALLRDLAGVILVAGREPDPDAAAKADEEALCILGTELDAFEISGRLWTLLKE